MPLPLLPDNNTDRVWMGYTSNGIQHDICWRVPNATTQADIITQATALANALKSIIPTGDSFNSLKHSDNGSTLSFPLAFTAVAGTGPAATETDDKTFFVSVVGRSLGGYRCKMTLFTPHLADTLGYRVPVTVTGTTQVFAGAVFAMAPAPVAKDGQTVIWNQYVNIGHNAYWQRELRP